MDKILIILIISITPFSFGISKPFLIKTVINEEGETRYTVEDKHIAPEFTLYTLEGKQVKLSDFRGKIVLLDFWATWCAPCRKSIPDLVAIQKEFNRDVQVIGISFDRSQTLDYLKKFIIDYEINYPVVMGTIEVTEDYGNIYAIPTLFIIDRDGNIIDQHIGLVSKSDLVEQIKLLINN